MYNWLLLIMLWLLHNFHLFPHYPVVVAPHFVQFEAAVQLILLQQLQIAVHLELRQQLDLEVHWDHGVFDNIDFVALFVFCD